MRNVPGLPVTQLIEEAYRLEEAGEIGAAVTCARDAVAGADDAGCADEQAATRVCLSYLLNHMGRFDEAAELARIGADLDVDDPRTHTDALMMRGICLTDLGRLEETEESLLAAMDLAREHGHLKALQKCLHVLSAGVYIPRGQFELALAADTESLRMADQLGNDDLRWATLVTLGWTQWMLGRRHEAVESLSQLRDIVHPYSLGEGYYFSLAADLAQDGDQPDLAVDFYNRARAVADIIGDPGLGAELRTGLSRYHRRFKSTSTAHSWACDAVAIAERAHSSPTLGPALIEKACCQWGLGDITGAKESLDRADEHARSLGALFDRARAQLFRAAILVHSKDQSGAEALMAAVDLVRKGGFWFLLEREKDLLFPMIAAILNHRNKAVARIAGEMLQRLEEVPPPPLRITILGSFEVRQGRRLIPARSLERRRAGDLLRLLLISRDRRVESDRAMAAIWPDKSQSAATNNLHQATSTLRRALEPDLPDKFPSRYLKVQQGMISLHLPPHSVVDCDVFEASFKRGDFAEALDLFAGDLFTGDLPGDSTVVLREHFRQRALQAATRVAIAAQQAEDHGAALEACLKALRLEPWHERSVGIAMKALLALDNRAGAIRMYQRLRDALHDELGVEPEPELQQLYKNVVTSTRS